MVKIAIDAGHGYKTLGKRCMKKLDANQTREWALNDRIADRLEELLKGYGCEVLRVDDTTGNADIALGKRTKAANNFNADIYISIHHNAGIKGGTGGGTNVYYYEGNQALAQRLYDAVVAQTGLVGNRASKTVKSTLYVLKHTNMKALLIENGFMDSAIDVPIILSNEHANKTAQGILNFLVNEFKLKKSGAATTQTTATVTTGSTVGSFKVKVKVSSLNYRTGAGTEYPVRGAIKDKGVYTIVATAKAKDGGTWGKLKSGAGWINIGSGYVKRLI